MRRKFPLLLVCLVATLGCQDRPKANPAELPATDKTFSLTIDFGDGKHKKFDALAWQQGVTVLDAMELAAKHKQGLSYSTWKNATGQSAFVEQIDGVKNEGGGEAARNWTYTVNDKKGQVSAGVQKLEPDDVVVWKFGVYEIE